MKNVVHLIDCMEYMPGFPDNHFDLAICDPPYGIYSERKRSGFLRQSTFDPRANEWDIRPDSDYFAELERISRYQIIWGMQYFADDLPDFSRVIIWDKENGGSFFADAEVAYCSIPGGTARIFRHKWIGAFRGSESGAEKLQETQKPIALYKWLLAKFARPGWTIFDSHVGSGSIRIACHDLGFDFVGCEIRPDYHAAQEARYQAHAAQLPLIEPDDIWEQSMPEQLDLDGVV